MTFSLGACLLALLCGELEGRILFSILGDRASGRFGTAISVLGDVNEDGTLDLAIGCPTEGEGLCFIGVHSGIDGKEIWKVDGVHFKDKLGTSMAAVGDLNGDGYPDLVAAYPTAWGAVDNFNRAWILSGRDGTKLLEILGGKEPEGFAAAVAPAGDLDGDAVPDVWIGSVFGRDDSRSGRVTAFSGKSGLEIRHINSPEGRMFGQALLWLDDIDSDGIGDLAVGGGDQEARLFLVSGGTGAILRSAMVDAFSEYPVSLARLGDHDGDGLPEIVVGAPPPINGAVTIVSSGGKVLRKMEVEQDEASLRFGQAVAGLPDLDGDNNPEFAVGAPASNGPGFVYVYSGKTGDMLLSLEGSHFRGGFGAALATADLDCNGSPELIVGEPGLDGVDGDWKGSVSVFTLSGFY